MCIPSTVEVTVVKKWTYTVFIGRWQHIKCLSKNISKLNFSHLLVNNTGRRTALQRHEKATTLTGGDVCFLNVMSPASCPACRMSHSA